MTVPGDRNGYSTDHGEFFSKLFEGTKGYSTFADRHSNPAIATPSPVHPVHLSSSSVPLGTYTG